MLGRKLRPFSLAHRTALEAIDSPLLSSEGNFTFSDLLVAAEVCSMRNPLGPLPGPKLTDVFRARRSRRRPDWFEHEGRKFAAYLEDYCASPQFWEKNDPSQKRNGVPWPLRVVCILMRYGHLDPQRVWTMPFGQALWYYTALSIQEGSDLDILTTEEEALLESLKAGKEDAP